LANAIPTIGLARIILFAPQQLALNLRLA
jgi:hypothetical protein